MKKVIRITLTGAPGIGKTLISQQLGELLAKNGFGVVFYADEMSTESLAACVNGCQENCAIVETRQGNTI